MYIHEVAQKTGLSPHTIRFYEKEGLLDERFIRRSQNNYRHYDDDVVERITLIKFGQTAGFTLSEIKVLMEAADTCQLTLNEQDKIIGQKLAEVEQKMAELEQVRSLLKAKLSIIHYQK